MHLRVVIPTLLLAAVSLAGCLEEGGGDVQSFEGGDVARIQGPARIETFTFERIPHVDYGLPETITGFDMVDFMQTPSGGQGVWIDREFDILYQTTGGALTIFDIGDPQSPKQLSSIENISARDVDILETAGLHLAVVAGSGQGMHFYDVTNPADPSLLATVPLPVGTHNVATVPGTAYVYNSGAGGIHVVDAANPFNATFKEIPIPETVNGQPVTTDGCHDITVRVDLGQAYCAGGGGAYMQGGGETHIWDISKDPTEPEWVGMIENHFVIYHHQALASHDGSVLIIDDEFIAPNCAHVEAGPAGFDTPTGAVWFYDITDPANPVELSHVQPPTPDPPAVNCGSHFGDLVDGRNVLAMGFYGAGTILVNFDDPANPELLDVQPPIGSTWDARYHNGHVFTGSGNTQILRLV